MLKFTAKGKIQVWNGTVLVSSHTQEREAYERISGLPPGKYTVTFPVIEVVSSGAFQSVYNTSSELGRAEARGMAVQVVRLLSDTTPPAVPSDFSASAATATSVILTLTANVESDFSNYVLERSSDNIGWGYLKSFTGTSTTDTVDVNNSVYYYRVFAIDTRGNRSAYSAVKSAGPYTTEFGWLNNIFPMTILAGSYVDLEPSINDPAGQLADIASVGTAFPSGVSIASTPTWRIVAASNATIGQSGGGHQLELRTSAEADWQTRISGSNVVWYHDFRSAVEVNAFRWVGGTGQGNDPGDLYAPGTCNYRTDDGITGGCLEVVRKAGTNDDGAWWRPFSPVRLLNASGVPVGYQDPAGGGTTLRDFTMDQSNGETQNWVGGYYGNSAYHAAYPGEFDGTEYWIQLRVKMDPMRIGTQLNWDATGGKVIYFTRTDASATSQEIVTRSGNPRPRAGDGGSIGFGDPSAQNYFWMYRSVSSELSDDSGGAATVGNQVKTDVPNTDTANFCKFAPAGMNLGGCWYWSGGWDTLMYHIRPGTNSGNDTLIEVWACHEGETTPTRIWYQPNADLPFFSGFPFGHNAFIGSAYTNGKLTDADFYHRYCQIIFSKSAIPWPTV